MISVEIEKEINQENKIIMNFNLRQIICISILAVSILLLKVFFKIQNEILIYPIIIISAILYGFGWHKQNGLPFEKVLIKQIQAIVYGSNTRKYKTKNQYVIMVNEEYTRRKNIDMADKKLKKQFEKELKRKEKELKKAEKKSVCRPVR